MTNVLEQDSPSINNSSSQDLNELSNEEVKEFSRIVLSEKSFYEKIGLEFISELAVENCSASNY